MMNTFYEDSLCEPRSGHSVEALRNSGLKRLNGFRSYIYIYIYIYDYKKIVTMPVFSASSWLILTSFLSHSPSGDSVN